MEVVLRTEETDPVDRVELMMVAISDEMAGMQALMRREGTGSRELVEVFMPIMRTGRSEGKIVDKWNRGAKPAGGHDEGGQREGVAVN